MLCTSTRKLLLVGNVPVGSMQITPHTQWKYSNPDEIASSHVKDYYVIPWYIAHSSKIFFNNIVQKKRIIRPKK